MMATVKLNSKDGNYEDIEIEDEKYEQLKAKCERDGITVEQFFAIALKHLEIDVTCYKMIKRLDEMEASITELLTRISEDREQIKELMLCPDFNFGGNDGS